MSVVVLIYLYYFSLVEFFYRLSITRWNATAMIHPAVGPTVAASASNDETPFCTDGSRSTGSIPVSGTLRWPNEPATDEQPTKRAVVRGQ
jgi:hypothetical protein